MKGICFETIDSKFNAHGGNEPTLPSRATSGAMAYDFFSSEDAFIPPNGRKMIWTDIKAHMTENVGLVLNVRSSMGKYGVRLVNTQGWIDCDYYDNPTNGGNIGICLANDGEAPYVIHQGDRIAQGMFIPYLTVENDDTYGERTGGFGSTGR